MAIESYSDLIASVQRFLKRQDLTSLVPDFITIAENHFDREIFTTGRRDTFQYTPTSTQISLPSDWKRIIRAYYNGVTLPYVTNDDQSGYANGLPYSIGFGYQIIGNTLSLSVPQLGQVLRLDYYTTIEPLSTANTSNWLLEDAPDIYLFGVLHEACSYIRDTTQQAYWLQKRDAAIADFVLADQMSRYPEQPLSMRNA